MTIKTDGPIEALHLCARRPGVDDAAFRAALESAAARCGAMDAELAMITPPSALPSLAHAAAPDAALPDAILTLRADVPTLRAALPEIARVLEPAVDGARSSLVAARRHAILPGRDAIRLFFGLRRLETLTLEAFHDYWLNRHADFGRRLIPPYTYHQLHADPDATAALAAEVGAPASTLDGVVEVHFPDLAAFVAQLSRPEVAEDALADERNFIDHGRSIFWAYRTV